VAVDCIAFVSFVQFIEDERRSYELSECFSVQLPRGEHPILLLEGASSPAFIMWLKRTAK